MAIMSFTIQWLCLNGLDITCMIKPRPNEISCSSIQQKEKKKKTNSNFSTNVREAIDNVCAVCIHGERVNTCLLRYYYSWHKDIWDTRTVMVPLNILYNAMIPSCSSPGFNLLHRVLKFSAQHSPMLSFESHHRSFYSTSCSQSLLCVLQAQSPAW